MLALGLDLFFLSAAAETLHLKQICNAAGILFFAPCPRSIKTTVTSLFRNTGVIQLILWDNMLPEITSGICSSLQNWVLDCFKFTESDEERFLQGYRVMFMKLVLSLSLCSEHTQRSASPFHRTGCSLISG